MLAAAPALQSGHRVRPPNFLVRNWGMSTSWPAAAAILADQDPVIRRLIAETGPPDVRPPAETHFEALVRAIVYQQLAGAAASAIHGRLIAAMDGDVTPQNMLSLPDERL